MTVTTSAVLGVCFLGLSVLATLTMYKFWGYPYDKERRESACPRWKMNIHRVIGLAYVALYVLFMIEMIPRLWTYQVEFPARTVAHISLGISIGVLLFVKIAIVRWFRHFEEWMPVLGTLLMLFTFILVGLSVPFVLKERALAAGALGEGAFSEESRARVAELLPEAGFSDEVDVEALATERSLRAGRQVLLNQCVECHDLKTAIESPRTPEAWRRTVERMAEKPTLGTAITEPEQREVTAYLVAITPELQRSEKARRDAAARHEQTREALERVLPLHGPESPGDAPAEAESEGSSEDAAEGEGEREAPAEGEDGAGEESAAAAEAPAEPTDEPAEAPTAEEDGAPAGDERPADGEGRAESEEAEEPADAEGDEEPAGAPDEGAEGEAEPDGAEGERAVEAAAVFESKCAQCHGLDDVYAAPPGSRDEARDLIRRMVDHGLSASDEELELIQDHLVREFVAE